VLFGKLAAMAVPNFFKALQKATWSQTELNQVVLACALERYRRAEGHYPESLASLSPRLIDRIPNDLIDGEPLKYRHTPNGSFTLYSIGWNEKDDGGVLASRREEGDWVWQAGAAE
jgi:type II secretory pathway pseudopilin PulG